MIGRRSSGWFEEVLLDDLKKIWWMVRRSSRGCSEGDLISGRQKTLWIVG
jgi:hypothetical protein